MPINATHSFFTAEKKYLSAESLEDKVFYLEEMIREAPKHKSSENLLKELRTRLKKLKAKSEKAAKKSGGKKGIRKEGFQCVLVGLPNSGKSSVLSKITNAHPKITPHPFATTQPEIGTMDYDGVKAQIVDIPSIGNENFNKSLVNSADCLLIIIEKISDLKDIKPHLERSKAKHRIIVFNKADVLSDTELRKAAATIKSKRLNGLLLSTKTLHNTLELKKKIFQAMHVIRVFTKEPGKPKTNLPIVLPENSTVKDAAEYIRKRFSKQVKETRLTGPSSKFPNQRVGLSHKLKDLDIIEFHTRKY